VFFQGQGLAFLERQSDRPDPGHLETGKRCRQATACAKRTRTVDFRQGIKKLIVDWNSHLRRPFLVEVV
jgi:hypothetical protein